MKLAELVVSGTKHPALNHSDNEVYQMSQGLRVVDMQEKQVNDIAFKVYSTAKFKLGLNSSNPAEEQIQIKLIVDDIRENKTLTEQEVMIATKNGLNGKYLSEGTTQVFFNSSNFHQWLKKYQLERNDILKTVANAKAIEEAKPIPTNQELKLMAIETANMYADEIDKANKEGKKFTFIAGGLSVLWDYLESFKIMTLSKEERLKLWEKYSNLETEERKMTCKNQGYILFVNQLVNFGCRLDNQGNIKPIEI